MKTIKLKSNGTGRYDDVSPFIITDSTLTLKVELPNFNGEFYLVTENNGKTCRRLLVRDVEIQLDGLTAGELNAEVKHYMKGELIKSYKAEPLLLKEVDGMLSAMPELEAIHRHICAVERTFEEYKESAEKRVKEAEERYNKLKANLLALVRFAFYDYSDNPYLDGGSFEEFASKFGFELTEEQIKTLKGENNNG